ncbi:coadhesin-like [Saccostrea echinata]|uniref:coadhesin-like n=1 Tax=Saccostrea echinata TaxID=191078 RepID=UPI002A7F58AE|nr:coadhesin-like [Saccostrea echinata]
MKYLVLFGLSILISNALSFENSIENHEKEKRSIFGYCYPSTGLRRSKCTSRAKYWWKTTYYFCNIRCRVNGGWSRWSSWGGWGSCSGNACIGQQQRQRWRRCTNPTPKNGGRRCYGTSRQTSSKPCLRKVNGRWSSWRSWQKSGSCSRTCGQGSILTTRERTCSNPRPRCGGRYCYGAPKQYSLKTCFLRHCKVNGGWGPWHSWSKYNTCSKTCGTGKRIRYRERNCNNPVPKYGGRTCLGKNRERDSALCNTQHCPLNGKWSEWGNWGHFRHCSETCGHGVRYRYRYRECNNPEPEHGGKKCPGSLKDEEFKRCLLRVCPKDQGNSKNSNANTYFTKAQKAKDFSLTPDSGLNKTENSSSDSTKNKDVDLLTNNIHLKINETFGELKTNGSMNESRFKLPTAQNNTKEPS